MHNANGRLRCVRSMEAYMSGLAQLCGVTARLQATPQSQQLISLLVKLDGLVQPHISHPDVAVKINSQAMGHKKLVLSPAGQHLSCVLQGHIGFERCLQPRLPDCFNA